jgi:alpha-glucosidase (family GH31 glycosyl hydrolase)
VTKAPPPIPLSIAVINERIIRVRIGADESAAIPSLLPSHDWSAKPVTASPGEPATIDTGTLVLKLEADPPRLLFCDRSGDVRLRLGLSEIQLQPRLRLRLELGGEPHFYGLGEGGQQFDRRGVTRRLWNSHINHGQGADIGVPILLSHQGYGLFFDNINLATIDGGDSDSIAWLDYGAEAGPLDLYYLGGDSLRGTLNDVAALLGRAPMPPRWSLGFLQSSRHFESAADLRELPALLRKKQLPCDGLIFLSTYGEGRGWNRGVGHLECEPMLLPKPEEAFADFRAQHFHVVTHEYPVLHPDSPLFAEATEKGYVLESGYPDLRSPTGPTTNYREGQRHLDFSNPKARVWWWEQHRDLVRLGVDGWWLDGGEGPPRSTKLHGGTGAALRNRYDVMRHQAFAEGEAKDRRDRRVFLLCRSGGTGMQRFGAACWSGDIDCTMSTLEGQVPIGLNTGMSSVPYWGTDIGGFYQVAPKNAELFARWFQFGAFCPVFRAHGRVWRDHVPWAHGPEVETICRRYLELRYRLMPYTYTLAWQAHTRGLPLMRPLVLNYPNDPRVWALGSEYLWGDDLLVAPVTREGATHWPVYLPEGRWYDFWTHERYDGPKGVTVPAPLDRLPLFVRAGAMIPMGPMVQYLDGQELTELTLLIYPEGHSSFTLYEDDGETNAYWQGRYALTEFTCAAEAGAIIVRAGAPQGDPSVLPASRSCIFQIHALRHPRSIELEGAGRLQENPGAATEGWWHDGAHFLFVRVKRYPATVRIAFDRGGRDA